MSDNDNLFFNILELRNSLGNHSYKNQFRYPSKKKV